MRRFIEFFAASIDNSNTRDAYWRACLHFFDWLDRVAQLDELVDIEAIHVAGWVEQLKTEYSPATVKQRLAAVRMLFDWLILGQIISSNPALPVRGPKHVVTTGKTPVLVSEEARQLLASIETRTVIGLRDRALISLLVYSFARIGAALAMNVNDYYRRNGGVWIRLHEKGGKHHEMPAHPELIAAMDAYLASARLGKGKKNPLFQSAPGTMPNLSGRRLNRRNALHMIKRRAIAAGLPDDICNHTFRATGITAYLSNRGLLEHAQKMAAHANASTTKLYDRTSDKIHIDEVSRISI